MERGRFTSRRYSWSEAYRWSRAIRFKGHCHRSRWNRVGANSHRKGYRWRGIRRLQGEVLVRHTEGLRRSHEVSQPRYSETCAESLTRFTRRIHLLAQHDEATTSPPSDNGASSGLQQQQRYLFIFRVSALSRPDFAFWAAFRTTSETPQLPPSRRLLSIPAVNTDFQTTPLVEENLPISAACLVRNLYLSTQIPTPVSTTSPISIVNCRYSPHSRLTAQYSRRDCEETVLRLHQLPKTSLDDQPLLARSIRGNYERPSPRMKIEWRKQCRTVRLNKQRGMNRVKRRNGK